MCIYVFIYTCTHVHTHTYVQLSTYKWIERIHVMKVSLPFQIAKKTACYHNCKFEKHSNSFECLGPGLVKDA